MTPTGNISAISLATELYGQEAIDTLAQFAPDEIRPTLMAQVFQLDWLLATRSVPNLGISDNYEWYLATWDDPSPRQVQLKVMHAELRYMSIAEVLKIERDAFSRANPKVQNMVRVTPMDIREYELREYIWDNLRNGHHWSRGLC